MHAALSNETRTSRAAARASACVGPTQSTMAHWVVAATTAATVATAMTMDREVHHHLHYGRKGIDDFVATVERQPELWKRCPNFHSIDIPTVP